MKFKPLLLFGVLWCMLCTVALAQNKTITGKITDKADGSPLVGVSVTVKGSSTGTVTDAEGQFKIGVPENATALVVTYVGYTRTEVQINGRSSINVQLTGEATSLNEVVVVGYGTQKAKDVTGALTSIGTKDFNKGVINSPEQLLQGRVSGVQVTPASGEPGAGVNIRIRGTSSIRAGNNPLFVVDGVPLDGGNITDGAADYGAGAQSARNPLNFLNPSDIENITVLKDASAAAIYGSRGANGVVLITTKKGIKGQPTLDFNTSASTASTLRRYDVMSAPDFLRLATQAGADAGVINRGSDVNWQDQIFRNGITQNYSLGFGGGNETSLYRLSLSYTGQDGIIKNSGLKRATARLNASHTLFDEKVRFDMQLTASRIDDQYAPVGNNAGFEGNLIGAALQANPTTPIRQADGTLTQASDFRNPMAMLDFISDKARTNRVLGNVGATWKIVDGLQYKFNGGIDNSTAVRSTALNRNLKFNDIENIGRALRLERELYSYILEHTLNYSKAFNDDNNFDALVGFSYQNFGSRGFNLQSRFFPVTDVPYEDNMGAVNNDGANKAFNGGSYRSGNELQSFFGRVNYGYKSKYLATATLRVDGSSKFGVNNKYGYFPAVNVGWVISEEGFMPKDVFQNLKLRAGYGITGNQEFPSGLTLVRNEYNAANNGTVAVNSPNPNLKWEETAQLGIGLDFALLNNRLTGSVDYFDKQSKNQLFQAFYAQPAPADYRYVNLPGKIINKGVEFSLNYAVISNDNFSWNVAGNATFIKNDVSGFGSTLIPTGAINGQGLSGAYAQRIQNGYPLGSFYLPVFTGYDADGFGTYANGGASSIVGSALPKNTYGLNNSFSYKDFSLSFFLNASTGFYVYNNTANALFLKGSLKNGRNVTYDAAESPENSLNSGSVSTRFLEKGDFIRLSNATLSYRVNLKNTNYIKGLSFNVTGQNLFLITKYSGVDPEVNTDKAINGIPSIGIDYTSYPSARILTVGANINF
ncbi:MAG: TonB-dependent receptor [Mucilaginibacter polytrichastri]|nr:TonB-dependent receptor [Mucilaginibacter polytrichastri]